MNSEWHFLVMIAASIIIFLLVVRAILTKEQFIKKINTILSLAFIVVVLGMTFGKYGATAGLPWWIYYPIPMLLTVFLPPFILKLSRPKTALYLALSFLSAPAIHLFFSFFIGWPEYMPFLKVPFIGDLLN